MKRHLEQDFGISGRNDREKERERIKGKGRNGMGERMA